MIDYRYPSWSPDGATLLFEGVEKDNGYSYDSYVMDHSGSVTRVTHSSCEQPAWVSNGEWIACPTLGGIKVIRVSSSDVTEKVELLIKVMNAEVTQTNDISTVIKLIEASGGASK